MAGSYHFELSGSVLVFKNNDVIADKNIADLILMIVVVLQKITLIWDEILHLFCEFQRALYSIVKVNRDVLLYKQLLNPDFIGTHGNFKMYVKHFLSASNQTTYQLFNKCVQDIIDQSSSFGRERVMEHFINSILVGKLNYLVSLIKISTVSCDKGLENIINNLELKFPSFAAKI